MVYKITISLPEELLAYLDVLVEQWKTTRSGAIANLLAQSKLKEIEEKMKQGYAAMSEEHLRNAEFFIAAQSEVVLRED